MTTRFLLCKVSTPAPRSTIKNIFCSKKINLSSKFFADWDTKLRRARCQMDKVSDRLQSQRKRDDEKVFHFFLFHLKALFSFDISLVCVSDIRARFFSDAISTLRFFVYFSEKSCQQMRNLYAKLHFCGINYSRCCFMHQIFQLFKASAVIKLRPSDFRKF